MFAKTLNDNHQNRAATDNAYQSMVKAGYLSQSDLDSIEVTRQECAAYNDYTMLIRLVAALWRQFQTGRRMR